MVAMANKGSDQNGSQFFITYGKQSHLDGGCIPTLPGASPTHFLDWHLTGQYTIFGRVIDGTEDTLAAMERVPVNAKYRPLEGIQLEKVRFVLHSALLAGLMLKCINDW